MLRWCTYVTVIDIFVLVFNICCTSVCSGDDCHSSGDWAGWGLIELVAFPLCKGEININSLVQRYQAPQWQVLFKAGADPDAVRVLVPAPFWPHVGCDGSSNDISRKSAPYLTPGHLSQFIRELWSMICDVCVVTYYLWHYRTSNLATTSQPPANRRLPANQFVSYKCFLA